MRFISDLRIMQAWAAALLFVLLGGTVALALALQYIWGFMPCELCLMERIPYYSGAGIMLLAFFAALLRRPKAAAALFALAALLMLYDCGLSVYHVGVEMKYWQGPTACSSAYLPGLPAEAGGLPESLNKTHIIPCDMPAGFIFGISFAGWNAIACFVFACCAALAAWAPFKLRRKAG